MLSTGAHYSLQEPELRVLCLICEGLDERGIACMLELPECEVDARIQSLLTKMGVRSKTEAAVRAFREHLV